MGAGTWRATAEEPAAQGTHPQTAYPRLMPTEPIPVSAPRGSFARHLERKDTRPPLLLAHRVRATHGIQWRNRFVGGESPNPTSTCGASLGLVEWRPAKTGSICGKENENAPNDIVSVFHVPSPFSPALTSHPYLHIHIRRARARGRPPQRLGRHGVIADGGGHERGESQETSARGGTAAGSGGLASGTVRTGPCRFCSDLPVRGTSFEGISRYKQLDEQERRVEGFQWRTDWSRIRRDGACGWVGQRRALQAAGAGRNANWEWTEAWV
ncbi:hypothetical protein B0H17DRAFT_1124043 [Mycena rosella]|uniref:Uncharacterized protein n=1 Tax=Mycena rosella TaxID=1033263 RepID=A0AAD7H3J7_MYCRO|nr:hypothetical protein B0H17DRAFT_1124043 [Mycena rosella]